MLIAPPIAAPPCEYASSLSNVYNQLASQGQRTIYVSRVKPAECLEAAKSALDKMGFRVTAFGDRQLLCVLQKSRSAKILIADIVIEPVSPRETVVRINNHNSLTNTMDKLVVHYYLNSLECLIKWAVSHIPSQAELAAEY